MLCQHWMICNLFSLDVLFCRSMRFLLGLLHLLIVLRLNVLLLLLPQLPPLLLTIHSGLGLGVCEAIPPLR